MLECPVLFKINCRRVGGTRVSLLLRFGCVGLLLVVGCEVVALHRGFRVVDGFGFCLGNRL